jgi:hypothetical protein
MKKSSNIFNKIALLLACTLLLFSCYKEDGANCPKFLRVYFTFSNKELNPANVDRMHLYVFDDKGYFVNDYRDDNIKGFSTDYYIECTGLNPGKYRFIAWGGKDERDYSVTPALFVKGKTTFDEALLMLEHSGNTVSSLPHHIFHAELQTAVVTSQKIQRFYMPLTQLSNTINIRTVGLPKVRHEKYDAEAWIRCFPDVQASTAPRRK